MHKGNQLEFIKILFRHNEIGSDEIEQNLKTVKPLLRVLNQREMDVITRRYGLEGNSGHSLVELSEMFAVSRERIKQLQKRALIKLRYAIHDIGRVKESEPKQFIRSIYPDKRIDDLKKMKEIADELINNKNLSEQTKMFIFTRILPITIKAQKALYYHHLKYPDFDIKKLLLSSAYSLLLIDRVGEKSVEKLIKIFDYLNSTQELKFN